MEQNNTLCAYILKRTVVLRCCGKRFWRYPTIALFIFHSLLPIKAHKTQTKLKKIKREILLWTSLWKLSQHSFLSCPFLACCLCRSHLSCFWFTSLSTKENINVNLFLLKNINNYYLVNEMWKLKSMSFYHCIKWTTKNIENNLQSVISS